MLWLRQNIFKHFRADCGSVNFSRYLALKLSVSPHGSSASRLLSTIVAAFFLVVGTGLGFASVLVVSFTSIVDPALSQIERRQEIARELIYANGWLDFVFTAIVVFVLVYSIAGFISHVRRICLRLLPKPFSLPILLFGITVSSFIMFGLFLAANY